MDRRPDVGQKFKLKPTARVEWLAWAHLDQTCVRAVRMDHPYGKALAEWVANDRNGLPPFNRIQLTQVSKEFWLHDLKSAVLA